MRIYSVTGFEPGPYPPRIEFAAHEKSDPRREAEKALTACGRRFKASSLQVALVKEPAE